MKKSPKSSSTKKTFKNFAEYWHLTKQLSEYHRNLLLNSMTPSEQVSLRESFDGGGWEFFFMRNACDEILDQIKKDTGIDLIELRIKVLNDHPQLVHKQFWEYATNFFGDIPWDHISYIFDGLEIMEHDKNYIKIVRYVPH